MTPCTVAWSVFTWTPVACDLDRGGRRAHVQRYVAIRRVVHLHGQAEFGSGETRRLNAHGILTRSQGAGVIESRLNSWSHSTAARWLCS